MKFKLTDFLPSSKDALDFVKIGAGLYLIGLLVMFFYLVQLNVLSVDLVKPQAIIIGIYIWLISDSLPKLFLFLLDKTKLKAFMHNLIFCILLFTTFLLIVYIIGVFNFQNIVFAFLMMLTILTGKNTDFNSKKIASLTSTVNSYLVTLIFCFLFSNSIFSNIPQYLGGGKPLTVKVYPENKQLFLSQFSRRQFDADSMIEADLLYEGDDSYYFIQKNGLDSSEIILNYKVKKIKKDQIQKIEFTKQNWISFKK